MVTEIMQNHTYYHKIDLKHNRRSTDALRNIYHDITGLSGDSENRVGFVYKPSVIRSG